MSAKKTPAKKVAKKETTAKKEPKTKKVEKTTVFEYKGYIGIKSHPKADGMIAPAGGGNIGCVCDASKVQISKEALELLKKIPRGRDGLGEIDVFGSGDKKIFGWMGGFLRVFKPSEIETSRDYDPSILTHTDGVEVPKDFKTFIDNL